MAVRTVRSDQATGTWRSVRAWRRFRDMSWGHVLVVVCGAVLFTLGSHLVRVNVERVLTAEGAHDHYIALGVAAFILVPVSICVVAFVFLIFPMLFKLRWDRSWFDDRPDVQERLDGFVRDYETGDGRESDRLDRMLDGFVGVTEDRR